MQIAKTLVGLFATTAVHPEAFEVTSHGHLRLSHKSIQLVSNATANVTTNLTVHPDVLALDSFVRGCTVAVSVRDDKLLPVDVLQRFCETTDAVVECRLQLEGPLKEVHARGGDVQQFCSSAYLWFQKKYGMYCPAQCEKLQCAPTCFWLEDRKDLDQEAERIKELSTQASAGQEELNQLEAALADAQQDAVKSNRSVAASQVQAERANASLNEELAEFFAQSKKSAAADTKVAEYDEMKQNLTRDEAGQDSKLTELQMRVDKADLNTGLREKESEALNASLHEVTEKLAKLESELEKNSDETQQLEAALEPENEKLQAFRARAGFGETNVQKKREKLQEAQRQLAAAEGSPNETKQEVDVLQDLVRQQRSRFEKAKNTFNMVETLVKKQELTVERFQKDIERLQEDAARLRNESDVKRGDAANLNDDIVVKADEAESSRNASEALKAQTANASAALAKVRNSLDHITRSLELNLQFQRKERAELEKVRSDTQRARSALSTAETSLKGQQATQESAAARLAILLKQVNKTTTTWEKENAGLVAQMKSHAEKVKALNRRKPDIVRQHNLGFF